MISGQDLLTRGASPAGTGRSPERLPQRISVRKILVRELALFVFMFVCWLICYCLSLLFLGTRAGTLARQVLGEDAPDVALPPRNHLGRAVLARQRLPSLLLPSHLPCSLHLACLVHSIPRSLAAIRLPVAFTSLLSLSPSPSLPLPLSLSPSLPLSLGRRADGSRGSPTPAVGDHQLIDKGVSVR